MMLGNLLGLIDPAGVARERFYSTNIPSRDFPYNLSHTKRKNFDAVALQYFQHLTPLRLKPKRFFSFAF